jgi:hypothetical protein
MYEMPWQLELQEVVVAVVVVGLAMELEDLAAVAVSLADLGTETEAVQVQN